MTQQTAPVDTMYVFAESRVPFAPIPTDIREMRFRHDDDWTFTGNPMRVLWEGAYRDAAHELIYNHEDKARRLARLGRDLEDAYLTRLGREADPR